MKILIVHAHENPGSFCSSLAQVAKETAISEKHEVMESQLYEMNFNPIGGRHDFESDSGATYYKYAMEQLHASQNEGFESLLSEEMKKLTQADRLIFNFPLWWWGMPAILKGWVDRVMAYGVAYGGDYGYYNEGRFINSKAMICTTTGSPELVYTNALHGYTVNRILDLIEKGTLGLVGFGVYPAFVAYGVSRITQEERFSLIEDYKIHLKKFFQ